MYNEFSKIYEEKIKEDIDYEKYAEFIVSRLEKYRTGTQSLLDMGAGSGLSSFALRKHFGKITLCEPSEEMLMIARQRFSMPYMPVFINGGGEFRSNVNKFDVVTAAYDVLNYMSDEDWDDFFENSYFNLKDSGLLIADISTVHKLRDHFGNKTYVYDDEDYFHVWENETEEDGERITINAFKKIGDSYKRVTEDQFMRFITEEAVLRSAEKCGFILLETTDDYRDKEAGQDTLREVFIFRKG